MKTCKVIDLGLIRYDEAVAVQQRLVAARKAGAVCDVLLLCEHPHVITLGRNGKQEHLRASHEMLRQKGVEFHQSNRGGDITYHGPGQLVGYPILNLGEIRRDVAWYVRQLEETMMQASARMGVTTWRIAGCTGVWSRATGSLSSENPASPERNEKLGAIGVHLSRWVTSHGFAYNVSTDLSYFDLIIPCGIANCRTTSLEKLLGRSMTVNEATPHVIAAFGQAMGLEMAALSRKQAREAAVGDVSADALDDALDEMCNWLSTAPQPMGAAIDGIP